MGLITTPYRPTQLSPGGVHLHNPLWKPPVTAELDRNHPHARGLVACWLLNEGAGTVVRDASGNNRHGTLTNMEAEDWVNSSPIMGRALNLGGTNEYVRVPWGGAATYSAWTFACWINAASGSAYAFGGFDAKTSDTNFGVYRVNDSTVTMRIAGGLYLNKGIGTVCDSTWRHIAFVWNGATLTPYNNGISGTSFAATGTMSIPAGDILTLGAYTRIPVYSVAMYSGWSAYSRALSPAEILSLYLDPHQMFRRSPIELWTAGTSEEEPTLTYAGTSSSDLQKVTGSASGTYTVPVYAGTSSSDLQKVTGSASGTYTVPVYAGTSSGSVQKVTCTASGIHRASVYSFPQGAVPIASVPKGAVPQSWPENGLMPTYLGTCSSDLQKVTCTASGTYTIPVYAGIIEATIVKVTSSSSGIFITPVYAGLSAATISKITCAASGIYAETLYSGTISGIIQKVTGSASGTYTVPVYAGTSSGSVQKVISLVSGTFVAPTYTGIASVSTKKVTGSASGIYAAILYIGSGIAIVEKITSNVSGTYTVPVYAGGISTTCKKIASDIEGLYTNITYTGIMEEDISQIIASARGRFYVGTAAAGAVAFTLIKRRK